MRPSVVAALVLAACGDPAPARPPEIAADLAAPAPDAAPAASAIARAPVQGHHPPELIVTPDELRFGFVPAGSENREEVTILNDDVQDVAIEAIALSPDGSPAFALDGPSEAVLRPGERITLGVTYAAPCGSTEPDHAELQVEAGASAWTVPASGFSSGGCLRFEPNPWTPGRTPLGFEPAASFNLTNCGLWQVRVVDLRCPPLEACPLGPGTTQLPADVDPYLRVSLIGDSILDIDRVEVDFVVDPSCTGDGRSTLVVPRE